MQEVLHLIPSTAKEEKQTKKGFNSYLGNKEAKGLTVFDPLINLILLYLF